MTPDGTYTVFPVESDMASASADSQIAQEVYRLIRDQEKRKKKKKSKKKKKREKALDKLPKSKKKPKKKSRKKSKKKGKSKKINCSDWVDDIIRDSASTILKITEMYAESKFFPGGRTSKLR
ncbi:hypothetical protein U6B65_13460 [Oscillospiraceae bacterium MB08-C2-2]|nr:hypothetical protein U6B65_13460 [Oscillospiraceae bacterium MB08-C2-2]